MEKQELEITIDREGKVSIQVRGVKGPGCLNLTQALEQALGGQVEERTRTAEYYQGPGTGQRQRTT